MNWYPILRRAGLAAVLPLALLLAFSAMPVSLAAAQQAPPDEQAAQAEAEAQAREAQQAEAEAQAEKEAREAQQAEAEAEKQLRRAQKEQARELRRQASAAKKAERERLRLERRAGMNGSSGRSLARWQERLRDSRLGEDPEVRGYLDLVDRGQANAAQLGELGSVLASKGAYRAAIDCYRAALRLDRENADLWVNFGTIQRQAGGTAAGVAAYRKALQLDPNHAMAHYSLGAAYGAQNRYDQAVEEYLTAFALDPDLADPATNPQVVNNDLLMAVQLIRYQQRSGAEAIPLITIPGGELPADRD